MTRSSGWLAGRLESSRKRDTRPTCALHTCAVTGRPGYATSTVTARRQAFAGQRKGLKIVVFVRLLLPSGGVEVLTKVPLLVQQADAHQRHTQIAGGLQMIAGQHAQPAREYVEALGQSEFGREVSHQQPVRAIIRAAIPGGFRREVGSHFLDQAIQLGQERIVFSRGLQLRLVDSPQHQHGVMPGGFPEVGIQAAEKFNGVVVPSPSQVVMPVDGDLRARPATKG